MRRAFPVSLLVIVLAVAGLLLPAAAEVDPVPFGPAPVPLTSATYQPSTASDTPSASLGAHLVFRATTPTDGAELWISDGTPAGTRLLKDIRPGAGDGFPSEFVSFRGQVYFRASDGEHGTEPWVTDGTADGTRMLKDIAPEAGIGGFRDPVVSGGRLYFAASTEEAGQELWVSDGTTAGTRMVADILAGLGGSGPRQLTAFQDKVVFSADANASFASKPFISDGTSAGTVRLDALPLGANLTPAAFTPLGDRVLFTTYSPDTGVDLWTSSGTAGDAHLVKDTYPGGDAGAAQLTRFGSRVLFIARSAEHGYEPWLTDGTAGGTVLLRDIADGAVSSTPFGYQVADGRAWFVARDAAHGAEVWVTDGTTAGTRLVRDVVPGPGGPDVEPVGAVVAGMPLFTLTTPTSGTELWLVDGAGNLNQAVDLLPGTGSSEPLPFGVVANTLFLRATGPAGERLYSYTLRSSDTRAHARKRFSRRAARARRIFVRARVSAVDTIPTGKVVLVRKGRVIGRATLHDGAARIRVRKRLGKGRHVFRVSYSGSVHARTSTSARVILRVR